MDIILYCECGYRINTIEDCKFIPRKKEWVDCKYGECKVLSVSYNFELNQVTVIVETNGEHALSRC